MIPYQPMNKAELAELERRFGRDLSEREALYLLRQERENAMREQIFYGAEPCRGVADVKSGQSPYGFGSEVHRGSELKAASLTEMSAAPSGISAEQIVSASERSWPWQIPALILLALICGEAWLAAHYVNLIESWFR